MSTWPRFVKVFIPAICVLAGVFLLVANSPSPRDHMISLEQSRLDALARSWETQITLAQAMFRDQIIRQGLLPALDRPQDWAAPRVQFKLDRMREMWGKETGILQAVALLGPDGSIHTCSGDSGRLHAAIRSLTRPASGEVVVLPRAPGTPEMLALHFRAPEVENGQPAGHAVAVVALGSFLSATQEVPSGWMMLAAPGQPIIASKNSPSRTPVSDATWPLLLAEGRGNVPLRDGTTLCFSRIQVPAMEPLLLVLPVATSSAAARVFGWLCFTAGIGWLAWLPFRSGPSPAPASAPTQPSASLEDTSVFRQFFHLLDDPVCLLGSDGQVVRANTAAHRWFHFHKGYPRQDMMIWHRGQDRRLSELLALAASDPQEMAGTFQVIVDGHDYQGALEAARLSSPHEGLVALRFRIEPVAAAVAPSPDPADSLPNQPDPCCPYPVLAVSVEGLITGFNDAARRICPRLEETPLLPEILPATGHDQQADMARLADGATFESLFGPRLHCFTVVRRDHHLYLYGHPLAASKNLEIELEQAQENFCTLCALSRHPVLLADPRDQRILEANAAAADLFQTTPSALRGRALSEFSAESWEFGQGNTEFFAEAANGAERRCELSYELIKVEGAPALLIVLEPLDTPPAPDCTPIAFADDVPAAAPVLPAAPPPLPIGPGLLVCLNPTVRETARRMLEKTGHECESFSSLDDVTVWLITHDVRPEFVAIDLTDYDEAASWIEELRGRCGEVPCLGFADGEHYPLPDDGPNSWLDKPFDFESLAAALAQLELEHALCSTLSDPA
ncbi:MAG: PAS domain-containing protein [bacterium]|nr:PAS domain-containing protein [bacterium]